jgi:hypothetical protein
MVPSPFSLSFCDASSCSLARPQTRLKSCADQRRTRPAGVPPGCRGAQLATLHSCKYRRLHARGLNPPTGTTGRRRSWLAPGRAAACKDLQDGPEQAAEARHRTRHPSARSDRSPTRPKPNLVARRNRARQVSRRRREPEPARAPEPHKSGAVRGRLSCERQSTARLRNTVLERGSTWDTRPAPCRGWNRSPVPPGCRRRSGLGERIQSRHARDALRASSSRPCS